LYALIKAHEVCQFAGNVYIDVTQTFNSGLYIIPGRCRVSEALINVSASFRGREQTTMTRTTKEGSDWAMGEKSTLDVAIKHARAPSFHLARSRDASKRRAINSPGRPPPPPPEPQPLALRDADTCDTWTSGVSRISSTEDERELISRGVEPRCGTVVETERIQDGAVASQCVFRPVDGPHPRPGG